MHMIFSARLRVSIILASLLLPPGCSVYFNTYYNAEIAFDEGYELHEKVMRTYPDSIIVTPPENARAKYDRAIEKADKVLEVYPRAAKWHDDAIFLLGKTYFYKNETGKAVKWFRELQEKYQQSPYVPESYLYCAKAYIVADNLPKAEETLKFALDRYPFLDKDQKISLLLVEIEIRREGKSQAITRLERVRASVRSQQQQIDLLLRVAELYVELKRYDQAIALLKKAPRNKKDPRQEYRIDRNLVSCWVAVDSLQKALNLLETMLSKKQYVPYYKELLFVNGRIFVRTGDIDEAIRCFKQVVGRTDSLTLAADTSTILSKAWFELGQLYQKRKGNYKEAERYYKLIADRQVQDSGVTPRAKARLKAISDMQALRISLKQHDTSVKRPAALFKIGELFYHELDEPDSACRQFLMATGDSIVDSVFTPKSLFAAAYIARNSLNDSLRADSLYKVVVGKFPGTDFSRKAQEAIKAPVIQKSRRELAAAAYREAEKLYLLHNDTKAAVKAYYNVYKQYSDLDIAPKSLFVAAWLTDNELQKKKVAKSLYEKICERYPKSVYCVDEANPRLKVVSDTLEALRRSEKKTGTGKKASPPASAPATTPPAPADTLPGVDSTGQADSSAATADSSAKGNSVAADSTRFMHDTISREPRSDSVSGPHDMIRQ